MTTKYEGGVIVYQMHFGLPKYLLIHKNNWEWEFPKGSSKKNASSLNTARQIAINGTKEKTNLDVKIDSKFHRTLKYTTPKGNSRVVQVFLSRVKPHVIVTPPKNQVMDYGWFDFRTGYRTLYYDNQRNVFYDANQFIRDHA